MKVYEIADIMKAIEVIGSYSPPSFRELVTLQDAVGRYCYDAIYSPSDYPPGRRSRMDGFACSSASNFDKIFTVCGDISAADTFEKIIGINECIRIATGARIPDGADLVVKLEDSNESTGGVFLHKYPDTIHNVEEKGALIKKKQLLIPENGKIDHRHVETLATLRINSVYVKGMRRIGILSTGSEITSRFSKDEMTINSNYYSLSSLLKVYGVPCASLGVCPDDKERLKDLISSGMSSFDALISFGGTAFSRYDLMKDVLRELGGHVVVDGLNSSPGKTFRFGLINKKPFFIFPGTPQAATICGEFFLTSWLRAAARIEEPFAESVIAFDVRKKAGFYKLIPCFSRIEKTLLVSYERQLLEDFNLCMRTVVVIPPEIEKVEKGSIVKTFIVY